MHCEDVNFSARWSACLLRTRIRGIAPLSLIKLADVRKHVENLTLWDNNRYYKRSTKPIMDLRENDVATAASGRSLKLVSVLPSISPCIHNERSNRPPCDKLVMMGSYDR